MQTINIIISDDLAPNEELFQIAKALGKKMLPSSKKAIGPGYELKNLDTVIKVQRISTEKPIVTYNCSICGTIFDKSVSKKFYSNYGGKAKQHLVCSDECRTNYMTLIGSDRCDLSKSKLNSKYVNSLFNR